MRKTLRAAMRRFLFILTLIVLNSFCTEQTKKEQQFKATVQQIVIAFSKQDSTAISKFINKTIGVYQLHRTGVFDHYNHFKTLGFSDTSYPQVLFRSSKGIQLLPLIYTTLPTWSCDNERWSKKGLFADTTKTDHLLSKICKDRNKYVPDNISDKTIRFFNDLENKSRRIVLYDDNRIELVFYLSYLNNRWFLTIVDNVSSDCSV